KREQHIPILTRKKGLKRRLRRARSIPIPNSEAATIVLGMRAFPLLRAQRGAHQDSVASRTSSAIFSDLVTCSVARAALDRAEVRNSAAQICAMTWRSLWSRRQPE